MNGHLIVFEGTCCTGKTTIFNPICQNFPVTKLVESIYMEEEIQLPPPRNCAEAIRNDMHFMEIDEKRWRKAIQLVGEGHHLVSERCIIGTLSICYGYHSIFHSFPTAVRYLMDLLKSGWFASPSAYLWFKADPEVIKERLSRKNSRKHLIGDGWTNPAALERQYLFLESYFNETSTPVYVVDGNTTISNRMKVVSSYLDHILSQPVPDLSAGREENSRKLIHFLERFVRRVEEEDLLLNEDADLRHH